MRAKAGSLVLREDFCLTYQTKIQRGTEGLQRKERPSTRTTNDRAFIVEVDQWIDSDM